MSTPASRIVYQEWQIVQIPVARAVGSLPDAWLYGMILGYLSRRSLRAACYVAEGILEACFAAGLAAGVTDECADLDERSAWCLFL